MTPEQFLSIWTEATGQRFRVVPYQVSIEAEQAAKAGFTKAEVELVIRFTQRAIDRQENGYNAQSLTWRVLAADGWQKFQERLNLAEQAMQRRGGKPKPPVAAVIHDGNGSVSRLVPAPEVEAKVIDLPAALIDLANQTRRVG